MTSKNSKGATQADVARLAGVSKMTVSKVLRGAGSISDDTQARVRAACDELGYIANALAGSLSSQKSSIVGVLIPSASDAIFSGVLSGINDIVRPQGIYNLIGESAFDPEIEFELIEMMMSLQPAGLIMTGGVGRLEKTTRLIERRRCPLLMLWDSEDSGGDGCVGLSHANAGRSIAQHFWDRGFQRPAYVGAELSLDLCADKRRAAFEEYLIEKGQRVAMCTDDALPRQPLSGKILTKRLLSETPKTDAIYYLNDAMAAGGLSWMFENGIRCPEQIAVAGFNGTSLAHTIRTKITTVDVPRREVGRASGRLLLQLIEGERSEGLRISVETQFLQGNTT